MLTTYLRAFEIGLIAGMRAMTALALLSHKLVRTVPTKQPELPVHYLAQPPVSLTLKVLAGVEILGDKVPHGPNRTSPPQFLARIASGATCGAFVSEVEGQPAPLGAGRSEYADFFQPARVARPRSGYPRCGGCAG